MALNPQLFPNGMPVAFVNEMFVLARDGVEFEVDKIPGAGYYSSSFLFIILLQFPKINLGKLDLLFLSTALCILIIGETYNLLVA